MPARKGSDHPLPDVMDMRRIGLIWCLATALMLPALAPSQAVAQRGFDAPVRYEDDYLSADFHRSRREAVLAFLPANGVAVIFGAPTRNRSNDVSYEYRQSSDFIYLT
ncbi:MAG: aminopeptidase P N-terminal domain-containing protein, partial [Gemmatimonadota bacterium]